MSFTPAIPSLSAPMGASPKPTLVLDLEGVAGQEVKLHEWLDASDGSYYDFAIDWGDGTVEKVDEDNFTSISHTYSSDAGGGISQPDGSVRARIVGKCEFLNGYDGSHIKPFLSKADIENTSTINTKGQIFRACSKLRVIGGRLFENCIHETNFSCNFLGCENLIEVPCGLFTNNHEATSFNWCFWGCSNLKTVDDCLFFSTSKVIDVSKCFYGCNKLESACLNLYSTKNYDSSLPNTSTLKSVYYYNIPNDDTKIVNFISLLQDRSTLDEKGTLYIRKNISEARDTLTEEQEAALNARGWILGIETTA